MATEQFESLTVAQLRQLAQEAGLHVTTHIRKQELIALLRASEAEKTVPFKEGKANNGETEAETIGAGEKASESQVPEKLHEGGQTGGSRPEVRPPHRDRAAASVRTSRRSFGPAREINERSRRGMNAFAPRRGAGDARQDLSERGRTSFGAERQDRDSVRERAASQETEKRPAFAAESGSAPVQDGDRRASSAAENERVGSVESLIRNGECEQAGGILGVMPEGYGFLRADNYLPGKNDIYISMAQIRRFGLKTGDLVTGKSRAVKEGERNTALLMVESVNGDDPETVRGRPSFERLIPVYPDERLTLEQPGKRDMAMRLIDLLAPIGKGQRGLIVSPPKAGKTTLLKNIANGISDRYPDMHLIMLLIDERPEEVTDMQRSTRGEVIYSTFDQQPEHHTRVAEMVLEHAQRRVEQGQDVVILLDSITRLARAYNLTIQPTGRSLSGGLDPGALYRPKRFFGAARNIEGGGSLTVLATALIDTGSRMDDIIYEEFKGTGNMELHLDRTLSERRIFPAIELNRSGTRREELLLDERELEGVRRIRRLLSGADNAAATGQLLDMMEKTANNREFLLRLNDWVAMMEKEGYSFRK